MKTLTINILNDSCGDVIIYDRKTLQSVQLKGKYSKEDVEHLELVLGSKDVIINWLGFGISYLSSELANLTTEELEEVCKSLNQALQERKNN